MYWEHQNNCAIRKGDWKAVKRLNAPNWKLFDIKKDRAEQTDLAHTQPDLVAELGQKWHEWAQQHYVLPKKAK